MGMLLRLFRLQSVCLRLHDCTTAFSRLKLRRPITMPLCPDCNDTKKKYDQCGVKVDCDCGNADIEDFTTFDLPTPPSFVLTTDADGNVKWVKVVSC